MATKRAGYHGCPGKDCPAEVPNRLLACRRHWDQLSAPVKAAVQATARYSILHPARREALAAAREEWADAPE